MKKYGIENFILETIEETNVPEEREKYWIEYYGSFKNGYNATIGGDGRPYIDYDLVVANYRKLKNQKAVANLMNISSDSVSLILKERKEHIYTSQEVIRAKTSKIVLMYSKQGDFIQSFSSLQDAAQYMIDNNLTGCKKDTIRTHISEVCRGKRKTAAGYIWKFEE